MAVRCIDLFVDLLLVRRLELSVGKLRTHLIHNSKIYARDVGLAQALLDTESVRYLLGPPVIGAS